MEQAPHSQELPVPELAVLQQCLTELELTPAVRQTLEEALTQSTKQLQQRLAQAVQQASRFSGLGQMAARMVHEIRNPLNAIFLHADVLEEEMRQPSPDSQAQMQESITEIRIEVRRLYAVMQDYLALARLTVMERVPEELGVLLKDCADEVQEQAEASGITLRLEGLARLGQVDLHRGSMRQAVLNLLQQALGAMPAGGTLTLRGRRTGALALVEVQHTGSNIPPEQLDVLFEPFHTIGPEWTGLGLYAVRDIMVAHHGTIDVQNTPDAGVKFTLTLPLAAGAIDQDG